MRKPEPSQTSTPALTALAEAGVEVEVLRYDVPTDAPRGGYGQTVAALLGIEPEQMFKTLMVTGPNGALGTAVIPVAQSLDLKRAAAAFGWKKAALADREVAERHTGSVVGGISPLGHRQPSPVVIDSSVEDLEALEIPIVVSGGQRGLSVSLSPADLLEASGASVVRLRAED